MAACNTETGDTNCCYAFGTYKCMGDPGKQKCTYAPNSYYDDSSDEDSSTDEDISDKNAL